MTISNLIKIYNLIKLFRWFVIIYISGFCIKTFAYHLTVKTLAMEIFSYILIVLFSWVFAVGIVNLIKDIKEGGVAYHMSRTIQTIKNIFNGFS